MRNCKRTVSLLVSFAFILLNSLGALASEYLIDDLEMTIKNSRAMLEENGISVEMIHISDLPENAVVNEIGSFEEYLAFLDEIMGSVTITIENEPVSSYAKGLPALAFMPYAFVATTQTVAQERVGIAASVNLNITAWYDNAILMGGFTSAFAFTEFVGFTYTFTWQESFCDAMIVNYGLHVNATASGTLGYYLLVPGISTLVYYSVPINLTGTLRY